MGLIQRTAVQRGEHGVDAVAVIAQAAHLLERVNYHPSPLRPLALANLFGDISTQFLKGDASFFKNLDDLVSVNRADRLADLAFL